MRKPWGERKDEKVESLTVPPGGQEELAFSIMIRARRPGYYVDTVSFRSNDPGNPECRVYARYHVFDGGISLLPTVLAFGKLKIGEKVKQVVQVWDESRLPRTISSVESKSTELLETKLRPEKEYRDRRTLIGTIEVAPNTSKEALLDSAIEIRFTDTRIRPMVMNVFGRVVN